MDNVTDYQIELRNLKIEDYDDLREAMELAYPGLDEPPWGQKHIQKLLDIFPEGQLGVAVNGKVVACALTLVVDYAKFGDRHTYEEITGKYTFNTHDSKGDVLYGIDIFVHPDYRDMRLGRRLYDARKELCENLNLRSIVAGGRIPGYEKYSDDLSPKQYIEKVKRGEIYDHILTFQLNNDFHVRKILQSYLVSDLKSKSFATLIEWHNIYFDESKKLINKRKSVIRLGIVQWKMRTEKTVEALEDDVEFFVDAMSDYNSDFLLFPEFFNAPLMAQFNEQSEWDAIRSLAGYTEHLKKKMMEFAVSYNVNIIAGSMPLLEDGRVYNVSYLCHRGGKCDMYRKIHITPDEAAAWGLVGGNSLSVFETDAGKIGILVCYDVEFPELARLLADQGMEILFVPFLTDTQRGYHRVRRCAQARAVENECYVAIAGCVGNLPKVENMDIQYAQSAVFSPSDFAFPAGGIVAEATPNTEMTLIADVNVDLLKELHSQGSVRILKDRRKDLYDVVWKGEVQ